MSPPDRSADSPAPFGSVLGVCSILHEAPGAGSAHLDFNGTPVLRQTLERLARCSNLGAVALLCWDDQLPAASAAADETGAHVLPHGPRGHIPAMHAASVAQRWSDGWRGGLLGTIPQDAGFFAPGVLAVARAAGADAVLLVDPSSALLDPALVEKLIGHAAARPGHDYYFTPAAPGLTGILLSLRLLEQLAARKAAPGSLLHYRPDHPQLDPVAADYCCHGPTRAARTLADFRLRSRRAVRWAQNVFTPDADAERLAIEADEARQQPAMPRALSIELTTRRQTRPAWLLPAGEADLDPRGLRELIVEVVAEADDLRLTLGGRGDPLLAPAWREVIAAAREVGVADIHVETDLLVDEAGVAALAESADVVSVHLPAVTPETYQAVMGADGYARVTRSLALLIALRQRLGRGTPIIVPTFVKCRANFPEMEAWYDGWLRTAGSAVIHGPDAFGNVAPPEVAVAAMSRTERCEPSLRVLADGTLTDELSRPLGRLGRTTARAAWAMRQAFQPAGGGAAQALTKEAA